MLVAAFAGLPNAIDGVVAWLGFTNLILLAFNLLPALPLDGGRVLRSALWYFRGDLQWATQVASGVGRGFGFLFIGLGVLMLIVEGAFSGAASVYRLVPAPGGERRGPLRGDQAGARRFKSPRPDDPLPVTVDADLSLGQFMDEVAWSRRYTTYPVLEHGHPIGLLAFRSVATVPRDEWNARRVRDASDSFRSGAAARRGRRGNRRAGRAVCERVNRGLVVDDGRLAGFVDWTLARAFEVARPSQTRSKRSARARALGGVEWPAPGLRRATSPSAAFPSLQPECPYRADACRLERCSRAHSDQTLVQVITLRRRGPPPPKAPILRRSDEDPADGVYTTHHHHLITHQWYLYPLIPTPPYLSFSYEGE